MASSRKKPNSVADMFPDDLVFELLIRLPGKQIARCKCVCKSWRSIIRSAQFKDVYGIRQRGLILHWFEPVFNPASGLDMSYSPMRLNIFYSPFRELMDPEQEDFSRLCELGTYSKNLRTTQIVNGLLCVDHGTAGTGTCLTIYNVCTREKMRIPTPFPSYKRSTYHLGYDPASKMYKLLRFMRYHNKKMVQAHIMTLRPSTSSSTWRELNHNASSDASVFWELRTYTSDGFICWMSWTEIESASIILFDLNKEKFRKILLPDRYLLKSIKFEDMFVRAQFMERHQRLAVSLWSFSLRRRFECFVMDDGKGKQWSHHSIENPQEKAAFAVPNGKSSGITGKMVLMNTVVNGDDVFSMMTRYEVELLHDRPFHMLHLWDFGRKSFISKLSCLLDGNNLYLPLDDILGGQI